jgi:hypothetical protein
MLRQDGQVAQKGRTRGTPSQARPRSARRGDRRGPCTLSSRNPCDGKALGTSITSCAQKKGKGCSRLRGSIFWGAQSPATEDFEDRLDLRLQILPRLEGVLDRGDLCSHRGW